MAGGRLRNEETFWCKRIIKFLRRRLLDFKNRRSLRDRERARTWTIDSWELLSLYLVNSVQSNTGIKLTCCWVFAGYRFCSLGFSLLGFRGAGKDPGFGWCRKIFTQQPKNSGCNKCEDLELFPSKLVELQGIGFSLLRRFSMGGAVPCHHGGSWSWAAASTGLIEYLTCRPSVSVLLETGNFVNSEKKRRVWSKSIG